MSSPSVKVRVQVTIEIDTGVWNQDATFLQLQEIAKREGIQILRGRLEGVGLKIIDSPKITACIIFE